MKITTLSWQNCKATDRQWDIFFSTRDLELNAHPLQFPRYPLILRERGNKYELLYGFDLYQIYRKRKIDSFPAYILPKNITWCATAKLVLDYHCQQNELYPVELARLLQLLIKHGISLQKISAELAAHVDFPLKTTHVKQYLPLTSLPLLLTEFLIQKKAPLKIWLLMSEMHPGASSFLSQFIQQTNPSLSIFMEISNHIYEIARRDHRRVEGIIDALGLTRLLNARHSASRKLALLRQQVRKARFPVLSATQQRIKAQIEQLNIPSHLKITTDPSLEARSLRVKAVIRNTAEWQQLQEFFARNDVTRIQRLLDIL